MTKPSATSNRLLEILRQDGSLTPDRLKILYRTLAKETHPDVAPGREEEFLELQKEYEEAMLLIDNYPETLSIEESSDLEELLSLFAVRGIARENLSVIEEISKRLNKTAPDAARDWENYETLFFKTLPEWQHRGPIFFTHNLFLSVFRQYQYYQENHNKRNRQLLTGLVKDLAAKVISRRVENGEVLVSLAQWLESRLSDID